MKKGFLVLTVLRLALSGCAGEEPVEETVWLAETQTALGDSYYRGRTQPCARS